MVRCVPPSPAGTTRRSPGAAQPTSTSLFAGRRATDGAVATAAAFAAAIAAVACCGDRTVGGLLAGRAAATWAWAWRKWWRRCPLFMFRGAGLAGVLFWSALRSYVCAHARGRLCRTPQALSWRVACPWDSESRQSAL
jgi:hypothetical protein